MALRRVFFKANSCLKVGVLALDPSGFQRKDANCQCEITLDLLKKTYGKKLKTYFPKLRLEAVNIRQGTSKSVCKETETQI